jgi:uncharacterized LabA/DUF88 family protein
LESIYYFSALATHLNDPGKIARHQVYITCLKATGIIPVLGRFKYKEIICPYCHKKIARYEEKETDVAIAVKLCDILSEDKCEVSVMMTGDTDLAPVVRHAKVSFPDKTIIFAFPYRRENTELGKLASGSFKMSRRSYERHQLGNPFLLPDGSRVNKPPAW